MKRILLLITLGFSTIVASAQKVKITSNNFVDANEVGKNYVIIDVPSKTKEQLYGDILKFVRKYYNNPKFVSTTTENQQIVVDALANEAVRTTIVLSGSNLWDFEYKVDMQFKDRKIKLEPIYKFLNNGEGTNISLIGRKVLGSATGLFNDKGKPLKEKALQQLDDFMNKYIALIQDAANKQNDNW